jgi:hypothetical protein
MYGTKVTDEKFLAKFDHISNGHIFINVYSNPSFTVGVTILKNTMVAKPIPCGKMQVGRTKPVVNIFHSQVHIQF